MSSDPHYDSQGRAAQGEFYSSGGLNESTGREPFEDGRSIEKETIGGRSTDDSFTSSSNTGAATGFGSNTGTSTQYGSNTAANEYERSTSGAATTTGLGAGAGSGSSFDNTRSGLTDDDNYGSSRTGGDNDVDDRSHGYGQHKGQGNLGGHTFGDEEGRVREGAAGTDRFDVDRSRSGVNSNDQDFDRTTGADRREDSQGRATGTHTTDQSIGSKIVNAIRGDKNA